MAALRDITDAAGQFFPLSGEDTIGRDTSNSVALADPRVSRRHAAVSRTADGRYMITDLGSTHGTHVGGKRITSVVLADGDEVRLGDRVLRFQDSPNRAEKPAVPAAAVPRTIERRVAVHHEPRFAAANQLQDTEQLRRDYEKLRAAYELTRSLGVEQDMDAMLDRILDVALKLLDADRGVILLGDPAGGRPGYHYARDRAGNRVQRTLSTTVINEVISTKTGIVSGDAGIDARFGRSTSILARQIRSTMCVPMLYHDEVIGVMHVDSQQACDLFGDKELELLTAIAMQAALAIKAATLRSRIRDVVAEERRRLHGIVSGLPTALLLLDRDRRIVLMNPAAEKILPVLTNARLGDVLERLGSRSFDEIGGPGVGSETEIDVPGPPRRLFVVSAAETMAERDGETVLLLRDVTVEREREARAAREDRMALVGQLAGGIAHDFNNLLNVILSYSEFLEQSMENPEMRLDAQAITQAGQRAAALVRQLMLFGRRQEEKASVVDLNQIITGMEMLVRRTVGEQIDLRTALSTSLWKIRVDPSKLEQVLMNLVVNARDAMESGGKLSVTTANLTLPESASRNGELLDAGRYVVMRVTDTGCGMTQEVASRVFEPFFTTKGAARGTGLGLATVYGIVRQAGGSIWVESAVGRGTTFEICFPIATTANGAMEEMEPGRMAPQPEPDLGPNHGALILIAEDEDAVRALTCRILKRAGFSVLEAPNGEEALHIAEERGGQIDLLLTDVIMPVMSGKQLREKLRAKWPQLPVLFMSGYSFQENIFDGTDGEPPLLNKPFSQQDLLAAVRDVLEHRSFSACA